VGETAAFDSLFWQFQEQADRYGAKPVFYQVSAELLSCYLDQGLSLFKLGEEAHINLNNFTLSGKQHDDLRTARNKFTKLGYQFEILDKTALEQVLPRLRQISDLWLESKHTREKRFSLGFFDEIYLRHTDIAVIKDVDGEIQAFANLWKNANHQELSIDLMRYTPEAPKAIMDFLFTELLLWGKTEQYQWFSLGMAPLAGLERHRLAPLWHKIGIAIFDICDQFYNFGGLYKYKAKFSPQWRPRYLAAPASISAPYILMIIARLISGGWQGLFGK
jgi:phosphatidylglycerol lysyltransferase